MKISRNAVRGKAIGVPELRFEERGLTAHAGLAAFQRLFAALGLRERLRGCFRHLAQGVYPPHAVALLLVVQLLVGHRRLRDLDGCRGDRSVLRAASLARLPDVSTVSRVLADVDGRCADAVREVGRQLVSERLAALRLRRATVDFDGSVLGTDRRAEGTAVGFNPRRKGQRSYFPLFATVAQTGQAYDLLHRPGDVADSSGAAAFMRETLGRLRRALPDAALESRMDSAFFDGKLLGALEEIGVEYAASVPFERFAALKDLVEGCADWRPAGPGVDVFEPDWKPKSWQAARRIVVVRRRAPIRSRGPIQLDLFEPRENGFDFKAIVTNKLDDAPAVALFHEGRGSQEALFGELKSQCALGRVPTRREPANRLFALLALLAHNLGRELQMAASPPQRETGPKRSPLWAFEQLRTMRRDFLNRAGRFARPGRKLVLYVAANSKTETKLTGYLNALTC